MLNNMKNGKVSSARFLDPRKKFDTVSHRFLLKKLHSNGIFGNTLNVFQFYLENITQTVDMNSILSDFKTIDIGIPQGSILGPLLLIIFC